MTPNSTSLISSTTPDLDRLLAALPASQDDDRVRAVAQARREVLRTWMVARGFDAVLISRRDHFAWLTAGGDSRVLNNSELGFGHLLITAGRQYLLAHFMDARRIFEEQVPGQGYELVTLDWYEGDPRQRALQLAGKNVAADSLLDGATEVSEQIGWLHAPLSDLEITRLRWLGRQTEAIFEEVAEVTRPGMTEREIAAQFQVRFAQADIDLDVLIIGSDERIFKYRHPLPTQKRLERYLLLHPAATRWGLHANITRSMHFGAPPEEVTRPYAAVAGIEGRILAALRPGLKFADLLTCQKQWYADLGIDEEWRGHFQGGPSGYQVVDTGRNQTNVAVSANQSFDWFVTARGAKVEELTLLTTEGAELLSQTGRWPSRTVETSQGPRQVPDIWVR